MGKGDKKTKRGKIIRGTYGKVRIRKKNKHENINVPKKKKKNPRPGEPPKEPFQPGIMWDGGL